MRAQRDCMRNRICASRAPEPEPVAQSVAGSGVGKWRERVRYPRSEMSGSNSRRRGASWGIERPWMLDAGLHRQLCWIRRRHHKFENLCRRRRAGSMPIGAWPEKAAWTCAGHPGHGLNGQRLEWRWLIRRRPSKGHYPLQS